jgi:chaperone modulatory protein CbpM
VQELIAEGILEPTDGPKATRLPYRSVRVTSTVIRLQRDLGVNLAGAALAVDLLERIEELRARLRQQQ